VERGTRIKIADVGMGGPNPSWAGDFVFLGSLTPIRLFVIHNWAAEVRARMAGD
jgi:hypothetical protein